MIKKLMIAVIVSILVGVGMIQMVDTVHAADTIIYAGEASFEYQWAYQYGTRDGGFERKQVESQIRTQTSVLNDGECTGEPDPKMFDHGNNQNFARLLQENKMMNQKKGAGNSPQLLQLGWGN